MHPDGRLLNDRPAAIWLAVALWVVTVAIFVVIAILTLRDLAEPVDEWFWELAVRTEWAPAVVVAKALRIIGSVWVMVPFEIAVGVWLFTRRRVKALLLWAIAIGVLETIVWVSKALYGRSRPPDALVSTTGESFPSGHSATAAVVAIGLVLVFAPIARSRRHWFMAAAGWATLMAASRVYLRAHWMTDVIAGAAVGAAVALTVALLVDRFGDIIRDQKNPTADE
jgi:undecaprenyl-diphosphatase